MKSCTVCRKAKPLYEFGKEYGKSPGLLEARCRACRNLARRIKRPRERMGPMPKPIEQRFWAKVDIGLGCWEWKAQVSRFGYGAFMGPDQKPVPAHRFSWTLHFGAIPEGLFVCHRCDNRRCVRPEHLFLGTHVDNMADMRVKGRSASGSRNGARRRLSEEAMWRVIGECRAGASYATVAARFGVSPATVGTIFRKLVGAR